MTHAWNEETSDFDRVGCLGEVVEVVEVKKNRADLMRRALRSGGWRSRYEIFNDAGQFFLTNNAASELRARGFTVEQRRKNGHFQYRLLGGAEGAHAGHEQPASGSRMALRSSEQAAPPQEAPSQVACSPIQLELETESRFGSSPGGAYASGESRAA